MAPVGLNSGRVRTEVRGTAPPEMPATRAGWRRRLADATGVYLVVVIFQIIRVLVHVS